MRRLLFAAAVAVIWMQLGLTMSTTAQTVQTTGKVVRIDNAAGRITLDHEPIKNLQMDRMTSVFRVKDAAMLKVVQVGDQAMFEADRIVGDLTVVKIEKFEELPTHQH